MKHLEILLFDEAIEMLKAYNEDEFDYFGEHHEDTHDLLSTLAKCITSDDYYQQYREYNRQLLETTHETQKEKD